MAWGIGLQVLLSTPIGLNLFPVRGWQVEGPLSYAQYVAVPTLALVLVSLGYNARFYRAVFVEELEETAKLALLLHGTRHRSLTAEQIRDVVDHFDVEWD